MGKVGDAGGYGLLYRRVNGVAAVAALMKPRSGGVEHEHHPVFKKGELNLDNRAGFVEPALMIYAFKALCHGFFYYGLAVGHTVKLAFDRSSFNRERVLAPDKLLPGGGKSALEKLLVASCLELGDDYLDPLGGAKTEVRPRGVRKGALKGHAPVLGGNVFGAHTLHFAGKHALEPEKAGAGYSQFFHTYSLIRVANAAHHD